MKISVRNYLNVYQYLQDCYQFRKKKDAQFSYDVWAKELKASDKSYVRFIVLGKRPLNEKMIAVFSENLKLDTDDSDYFSVLAHYTQSKTQEQKNVFWKKLLSYLNQSSDQLEINDHYEFLSNPLLPRLQILLSFTDLNATPETLAWILGCTEEEVSLAMDKLLELKIIEKTNQGYKPLQKSFKVPDRFGHHGLEAFYQRNLDEAKNAISLPKEERRFKSLFLPLNEKEFNEYLKGLETFTSENLTKFNPDTYEDRRLYQIHYNIIPISFANKK